MLLKIGQVARRAAIGVETLRFYEKRGLVSPTGRTASGYRYYDAAVFERLEFIRKSQAVGFSLDEIARIIDEAGRGKKPCAEVRRLVAGRLEALDRKLAELKRYRRELRRTLDDWEREGESGGEICGLIESLDADRFHPPSRGARR